MTPLERKHIKSLRRLLFAEYKLKLTILETSSLDPNAKFVRLVMKDRVKIARLECERNRLKLTINGFQKQLGETK